MTSLDDRLAVLERQRLMHAERRAQRLYAMLDAIAAWSVSHGEDRDYWRWMAQTALADFKLYHLKPEATAFNAAVLRTQAAAWAGMFRDHNCWKCNNGAKPCVQGHPRQCEYPHAKNDAVARTREAHKAELARIFAPGVMTGEPWAR